MNSLYIIRNKQLFLRWSRRQRNIAEILGNVEREFGGWFQTITLEEVVVFGVFDMFALFFGE